MANELTLFELALLRRIAADKPQLLARIAELQVDRRDFSGAGSFTRFKPHGAVALPDGYIGLDALISMPGVENGMGASIAVTSRQIEELEIYTYGIATWLGDFEGFNIEDAA